jgi:hypothetical protein
VLYIGLDIHDKRIAICVLGESGQIARRVQVRTIDEMMRFLEAPPDRFEVCYEASCNDGHYHDLLRPIIAMIPNRWLSESRHVGFRFVDCRH